MNNNIVIRVENLSKEYKLGLVVHDKLADLISSGADKVADGIKKLLNISKPDDTNQNIKKQDMPEYIWALKDVSFEVKQGEVLGIIGRNGAGKSTLLKILTGITEPTEGKILIKGRIGSLLEVGTGFHPELTGRENIFLNGVILGMSKGEISKKFDEIVAFAEIDKFIDTPVKRYSSGMYVRLAFAVAAHLEPEILFIDEVLAVGDIPFQKKCIDKMHDVATKGRSILFVSHGMSAIMDLCHSCIRLEKGTIKDYGNTSEVIYRYLEDGKIRVDKSLAERVDRGGDGRVRIINLRFMDAITHKPLDNIVSGQNVYIEITYKSTDYACSEIKKINLGLAFFNTLGQFIMVLNSDMASKKFEFLPANGCVYCHIPKFPLMAGYFTININLLVNHSYADVVENAVTIYVETADFFGTGNPNSFGRQGVYVPHYWSEDKSFLV